MSSPNRRWFFLVAILLLAFALRVVGLDDLPPGLSHDEAYNGVTAIQVLEGQRPIFFEINKGIEPLIIYLDALAFYAFGIGPVPLRLVNVACGMLTVALVYPLSVRLLNRRIALLAMFGVAVSFWALFSSRLALRAVTLPPLVMLTLYFLWCGLGPTDKVPRLTAKFQYLPSLTYFTLSGLAAGASMYTYLSSRFVPLLLVAIFGYQLLRRRITKRHWLGMFGLMLIWAAVFAPLAHYFWQHQERFTERSSQVSTIPYALNGDFGPLIRHTWRTLGMFTWHGDETDRYNLDGRPVFDWFNGLFFYLGSGLILVKLRRPPVQSEAAAFLLGWIFFMLLPGFITEDSPHFLRTIGALPVAYILWAWGLAWTLKKLGVFLSRRQWRWGNGAWQAAGFTFPVFFISTLLLLTTFHTGYDYFIRWGSAPGARRIYGADVAEAAHHLNTTPQKDLVVISAEYYRDLDPFRFILHGRGRPPFVIWFDGRQSLAFPPPASGLNPRYFFLASAPPADAWQPFLEPVPSESGRAYTVYRLIDPSARQQAMAQFFAAEQTLGINVNNDLIISAYRVLGEVMSGGKFQVVLGWQALQTLPPGSDYTFLVRLTDSQGHVWAESDGNGYAPSDWQPGVLGLQLVTLRLPGDLPQRRYNLTLQVVDRRKGQALPTLTGDTVITLETRPGRLAHSPRLLDPDKLPNPLPLDPVVGQQGDIVLRGYKVHNDTVGPDDTVALTLHWQVLRQPQFDDDLVFTLTDEAGRIISRWPALPPINGEWPTSQWPAAYWVQDRLDLPITSELPPGQFNLQVSWLARKTESVSFNPDPARFDLGRVTITN